MKFRTVLALVFAVGLLAINIRSEPLAQDRGAPGTWQKLLKLRITASAMHTTAHPDDEHGGVLTWLSRGLGARMALLTLNRGESGDNAIGPELFDAVGLIRTEELLAADRYYGIDAQYFTTVIDYGFSKRLDEALEKWGRQNVLRDVVRVIRMDRPFVLISRFQGNERDGHGNHQTAGLITQEAFKAAGDPLLFPEQSAQGLQPWQPQKLYMGGVRENEDWTIRTDSGEYSPWLGESYHNFSRIGLSYQRSQNSGRLALTPGHAVSYYKRLASLVPAPDRETSFFDGIDTSISGLFRALRRTPPPAAPGALAAIDREIQSAIDSFTMADPSAVVPALTRGLKAIRDAIRQLESEPDAVFILRVKEHQCADAINTALGLEFAAVAQPAGLKEPTGPFAAFAPPAVMGPIVPGQTFEIVTALTNRGRIPIAPESISVQAPVGWSVATPTLTAGVLNNNDTLTQRFKVTAADLAAVSRPYFSRKSIAETHYDISDPAQRHRPAAAPVLVAIARYSVNGVTVDVQETVRRREANLPYGYEMRELMIVPAIAVNVTPKQAIVPLAAANTSLTVHVDLLNNKDGSTTGELSLELPSGWTAAPASQPFTFSRAGERSSYQFTVTVPSLENREYQVQALASIDGKRFQEGYDIIQHRDLETRYLYHPAIAQVRGIDVKIAPRLSVGYVMGVGDEVPAAIGQLGAKVQLLGEKDLAAADLQQFHAIVNGTRAYAVREDLKTYNQRLLDYVKGGGNLIVLYNTQEFVPDKYAPYGAQLPAQAEEVSEEDSPVEILAPDSPVFNSPNRITLTDFNGWVEQRGSKFFTEWDKAYTPMIATHDKGQPPQRGGWLTARYGKGYYTYFAYAFHRQLPFGVPGAYRILANLLSLGRS